MNWYLLTGIGVTLILIGFFTGLETAFASMNRFSVELKKKQGHASGRILSAFAEQPGRFIGVSLVGITISVVLYGLFVNRFIDPLWKQLPAVLQGAYLRLFLELSLTTFLVLFVEFSFWLISEQKVTAFLLFLQESFSFFMDCLHL